MRDLTRKGFSSTKPLNNYIRLQDEIDTLRTRIREVEQSLLELLAK
ncbi:MAG TPA: hypothetical protein VJG83_02585 [archaeon]|nr:hypothetical protein [archaeon]